jgi:hypothetical protein
MVTTLAPKFRWPIWTGCSGTAKRDTKCLIGGPKCLEKRLQSARHPTRRILPSISELWIRDVRSAVSPSDAVRVMAPPISESVVVKTATAKGRNFAGRLMKRAEGPLLPRRPTITRTAQNRNPKQAGYFTSRSSGTIPCAIWISHMKRSRHGRHCPWDSLSPSYCSV